MRRISRNCDVKLALRVTAAPLPNSASSHDGKKQVVTVPGSLRKLQAIEPPSKHEDLDFTAASLKHI
ncbi:unnamed protein product [Rotaria magnacalcarata]|uniref:Uncharacterized protein n=1 Tax=Rotaria magnacalcarata TaxID=392030 RepID=A0A816EIX0_9BILA|nr:unnamed protein product [Rotaria magnacalcarata]